MKAVAAEFGVGRATAGKGLARCQQEGVAGLRDRSSRPHRSPARLSGERETGVEPLRANA